MKLKINYFCTFLLMIGRYYKIISLLILVNFNVNYCVMNLLCINLWGYYFCKITRLYSFKINTIISWYENLALNT